MVGAGHILTLSNCDSSASENLDLHQHTYVDGDFEPTCACDLVQPMNFSEGILTVQWSWQSTNTNYLLGPDVCNP